jgi:hypothetical protein
MGTKVTLAEAHAGDMARLLGRHNREVGTLTRAAFSARCHLLSGGPSTLSAALEGSASDAVPLAFGLAGAG